MFAKKKLFYASFVLTLIDRNLKKQIFALKVSNINQLKQLSLEDLNTSQTLQDLMNLQSGNSQQANAVQNKANSKIEDNSQKQQASQDDITTQLNDLMQNSKNQTNQINLQIKNDKQMNDLKDDLSFLEHIDKKIDNKVDDQQKDTKTQFASFSVRPAKQKSSNYDKYTQSIDKIKQEIGYNGPNTFKRDDQKASGIKAPANYITPASQVKKSSPLSLEMIDKLYNSDDDEDNKPKKSKKTKKEKKEPEPSQDMQMLTNLIPQSNQGISTNQKFQNQQTNVTKISSDFSNSYESTDNQISDKQIKQILEQSPILEQKIKDEVQKAQPDLNNQINSIVEREVTKLKDPMNQILDKLAQNNQSDESTQLAIKQIAEVKTDLIMMQSSCRDMQSKIEKQDQINQLIVKQLQSIKK